MTRFTAEYLEFREKLDNKLLVNLSLTLKEMNAQRLLPENTLKVVKIGTQAACHIYVDKNAGTIWLLGGHWVRDGEPSPAFLAKMRYYAAEILAGREP